MAARQVYEGSRQIRGEVMVSPYLQAAYPDFQALTGSGEFFLLGQAWLQPMCAALYAKREGAQAGAGSDSGL
jgi:hypothetical protein